MKTWIADLELRQRILIALIAVDHLVLVLLTLGNCARGETISASAWRQEQAGKLQGRIARPVIDWLFTWVERDHCSQSWLAEKHRYPTPPHKL
jgi:hypothetical protein